MRKVDNILSRLLEFDGIYAIYLKFNTTEIYFILRLSRNSYSKSPVPIVIEIHSVLLMIRLAGGRNFPPL
jgi:hypothetical protein